MNAGPSPREGVRTETPLHAKLSMSANGEHLITWGGVSNTFTDIVREAEVQKYMLTYHMEGKFDSMLICLYCSFRSNKYISAC